MLIVTAAWVTTLAAAGSLDLKRTTPVPAGEPIPVIDFVRPSLMASPAFSPDGARIAARITDGTEDFSLMVYDTKTKLMDTLHGDVDQDIYWYSWLGDQSLAYMISDRKMFGFGLFAADVSNLSHPRALITASSARFLSAPRKDRLHPLVWIDRSPGTRRDKPVVKLNSTLEGSWWTEAKPGGGADAQEQQDNRHIVAVTNQPDRGIIVNYLTDPNGELEFCITSEEGVESLYRLDGEKWIKCPVDLDQIDIIGAGNVRGELAVVSPRQQEHPRALQLMDAATGKLGQVLIQDKEYDFNGSLIRDPRTGRITGAKFERNGPTVVWFDPEMAALYHTVAASLPHGDFVSIVSQSEVGHRLITERYSDRQPPAYDWIDLDAHSAELLKNGDPWIDPARMRPMQVLRFKTFDGKLLDGYLTLPAGASKDHPVPMVVLPHDGPYERSTWGYDSLVQLLASRGYAVLQPNYRGSPGYDWKFPDSDRWDFLKMRADVISATKGVLSTHIVDENRVAIIGFGFGAYLAVGCCVDEPKLFSCAVAFDGVYDWADWAGDMKEYAYTNTWFGWIKRRLGDPKENADRLIAISPTRQADKIRAAVLVGYSRLNGFSSLRQSHVLISALNDAHVPCETSVRGDTWHGTNLEGLVDVYTQVEDFFRRHLSQGAVAPKP